MSLRAKAIPCGCRSCCTPSCSFLRVAVSTDLLPALLDETSPTLLEEADFTEGCFLSFRRHLSSPPPSARVPVPSEVFLRFSLLRKCRIFCRFEELLGSSSCLASPRSILVAFRAFSATRFFLDVWLLSVLQHPAESLLLYPPAPAALSRTGLPGRSARSGLPPPRRQSNERRACPSRDGPALPGSTRAASHALHTILQSRAQASASSTSRSAKFPTRILAAMCTNCDHEQLYFFPPLEPAGKMGKDAAVAHMHATMAVWPGPEACGTTAHEAEALMKLDAAKQEPLVAVIAAMLQETVERNDRSNKQSTLSSFCGRRPPLAAAAFVTRVAKYSGASPCCFAAGLIYLERMKKRDASVCLTSANFQRLFLVSVMCASKFLDDFYYSNKHWAEVGGLQTAELNKLEIEFLFRMGFSLHMQREEYDWYAEELHSRVRPEHLCEPAAAAQAPGPGPRQASRVCTTQGSTVRLIEQTQNDAGGWRY